MEEAEARAQHRQEENQQEKKKDKKRTSGPSLSLACCPSARCSQYTYWNTAAVVVEVRVNRSSKQPQSAAAAAVLAGWPSVRYRVNDVVGGNRNIPGKKHRTEQLITYHDERQPSFFFGDPISNDSALYCRGTLYILPARHPDKESKKLKKCCWDFGDLGLLPVSSNVLVWWDPPATTMQRLYRARRDHNKQVRMGI